MKARKGKAKKAWKDFKRGKTASRAAKKAREIAGKIRESARRKSHRFLAAGKMARQALLRRKASAQARKTGFQKWKGFKPKRTADKKPEGIAPWKIVAGALIVVITLFLASLAFQGEYAALPSPSASVAQENGSLVILWNEVQGAEAYAVYRSLDAGVTGVWVAQAGALERSFIDRNVSDAVRYYYLVRPVKNNREGEASPQVSALVDLSPPEALQIRINDGAEYTRQKKVFLSLYASGASQCRLGMRGVWGEWTAFASWKEFEAYELDGKKTISFQCRDAAGNLAKPVNASIILDENPPMVEILTPTSESFPLDFNASFRAEDAVSPSLACTARVDGKTVSSKAVEEGNAESVPLSLAEGSHSLEVECVDEAGWSASAKTSFKAAQPLVYYGIPFMPLMQINHGAKYTNSMLVTLYMNASGASECRWWNDGEAKNEAAWESAVPVRIWTLKGDYGYNVVNVQCKNSFGVTDSAGASIFLDGIQPQPVKDLEAANLAGGKIKLSWTPAKDGIVDEASGVKAYQVYRTAFSFNGFTLLGTTSPGQTVWVDEAAANGQEYYYKVYAVDVAGNVGMEGNVAQITGDADPPSVYLYKPKEGDSYVGGVEIEFGVTDAVSRTLSCQIQIDGKNGAAQEVVSGSVKKTQLSILPGTHSLKVACADEAGNQGETKSISFSVMEYA